MPFEIAFLPVLANILLDYLIFFFTGHFVFKWATRNVEHSIPFFVELPISISIGLVFLIPLYFFACTITLSIFTAIILFLFCIVGLLKFVHWSQIKYFAGNLLRLENIIPLVLLAFSITCFCFAIYLIGWPPAGDIMHEHGPLAAIILYNNRLPITL